MKLSIHIGINQYDPRKYGSANLQQCVRDAETMCAMAGARGFYPLMITDESATKPEIISILKEHANKMQAGDTLLLTQSSHGTYFDTGTGRATGLCMHDDVLWDFEQPEIWKLFKPGVLIIRLVDACFSESSFRAALPPGTSERFTSLLGPQTIKPTSASLRSCKCQIISISSSNIREVSYENEEGGVFTQALHRVIASDPSRSLTYRKVHASIAKEIKRVGYPQTPKIETQNAGAHARFTPFGQ